MNQEELNEYYEYDNILSRMLDKIPSNIDKREGSVIYNAVAPAALELAQIYFILSNNIDLCFADTAVDIYLDRICSQVGVVRKSATKAIRKIEVTGSQPNYTLDIDIGTRFSTGDITFQVIEKLEYGVYKVECETAGTIGNNLIGSLLPVDYIDNLGSATLTDILIPGEDEETDEELRARYFEHINEKAFAGNITDYKIKTKQIDGVGAVKVTPVWNGGGTVKLTILNSEFNKASDVLVQKVQDEICPDGSDKGLGLAPVGHSVTVETAIENVINVSTNITVTEGSSKDLVKQEVIKQINNYFSELRRNWENSQKLVVRLSQIEARILNIEDVLDLENTTLNGNTTNIELEEMEVPILGEVNVL